MKEGRTNRPNLDGEELAAIFEVAEREGGWKEADAAALRTTGRKHDQKTTRKVYQAALKFKGMTPSELRSLSEKDAKGIAEDVGYDVSPTRIRSLARSFASWKQEGDDSTESKLRHRAVERHQNELLNIAGGLRSRLRVPRAEDAAFVIPYGYGTDTYKWKSDDDEALIGWQYIKLGPNTIKSNRGIEVKFLVIEDSPLFPGLLEHLIAEGLESEFLELKDVLKQYATLCVRQNPKPVNGDASVAAELEVIRGEAEVLAKNLNGQLRAILKRGYMAGICQSCP